MKSTFQVMIMIAKSDQSGFLFVCLFGYLFQLLPNMIIVFEQKKLLQNEDDNNK